MDGRFYGGWWQQVGKAAAQGDADAQYNLGVMYEEGKGVIQDKELAHMWYNVSNATGMNSEPRTGKSQPTK